MRRGGGRALVVLAAGFVGLDAVLLLMAGAWTGRRELTLWGLVFVLGTVAVVVLWKRYLRNLVDVDEARAARAALAGEVERLRRSAGLPLPTGRREKRS
jgi:membrane protein implicated in regulation of membrane protease activity